MSFDPRHLRILLAVVRSGSFSAAAEALNMSQPSVSVSIARLEDLIGKTVVIRDHKGARLTEEGQVLLRHAEAIELIMGQAREELLAYMDGIAGPMTLGGTPGALLAIAPAVLARMQGTSNKVDIALIEMADDQIGPALRRREVSMALCPGRLCALEPDLEEISLQIEPFVLIGAPGTLPREGLSIHEAASRPWIFPHREGETRRQFEAAFINEGVCVPRNVIRCDTLSTQKEMLRRGQAIALLPRSVVAMELEHGILTSAPLHNGPPPRRLVAKKLRQTSLPPLAERFLALACETQEL